MSNIIESPSQKPARQEKTATALFSNRCPIQFGYFSVPAYYHRTDPITKKIIRLVNYADAGVEQFINIEAFPETGLPTTVDLTLYLAFQKLLDEDYKYLRNSEEQIYFSKTDLLGKIGLTDGDLNLERVSEWGQRMKETAIRFFENEERKKVFGTFSIFQEFITKGTLLEDNSVAEENWIRLTRWELDNRLNKPPIPIDFTTYLKIKNKTAQLLIPHLQVWLYASAKTNLFRKSYTELCHLLGLRPQKSISEIKRQFNKAFEILIKEEYLKRAEIYKSNQGGFVIELAHGTKFFRDQKMFLLINGGKSAPEAEFNPSEESAADQAHQPDLKLLPTTAPEATMTDEQMRLLEKLLVKEIDEKCAIEIVLARSVEDVELIILYCEHLFTESPEKYTSQRGYLFTLLKNLKFKVPESFKTEISLREKNGGKTEEEKQTVNEADREMVNFTWLQEQFDEFCFTEASKQLQPEFSLFVRSYEKGSQIWESILTELRNKLNAQIFNAWFEPVKFAGLVEENRTLQIAATAVARDWISSYYAGQINDALTKLDLSDYKLSWIIREQNRDEDSTEHFYRLTLIDNYQQDSGITFDDFCQKNKKELEAKFNVYFDALRDRS